MDPQRRLFLRGKPTTKDAQRSPRPPWALAEAVFVKRCTRCDACIEACPESILFRGDGGFPEVSFSQTGCTACGHCVEACSPDALVRKPSQAGWSWQANIGATCLAMKKVECRVCGEICDAAAIRFKPTLGGIASPALDLSRCTGCGACVAPCPTQAITMKEPAL